MASKDYDDLLDSFMSNSKKAYNEDKTSREDNKKNIPASYKSFDSSDKKNKKMQRGRNIEKELAAKDKKKMKKKAAKSSASKARSTIGKVLLGAIMVVSVVGIVCFSVIAIYGYSVVYGDPVFDLTEETLSQNQTSFIYGYDGDDIIEITRLHGEENRIWVNIEDMSKYLPEAFIAIEDKRFYEHSGVDWYRTIAVFIKQNNQGGSTITQQLIKNLTDDNKVTYIRKFNEILRALNLERNYSKEEILEAYLNTIYLSNGCYGVQTAVETYFGKEPADLNAAECASIAAITQYPSQYDPLNNPDDNRDRQLDVLEAMNENGYLTDSEYQDTVAYEMVFTNSENYTGSQIEDDTTELTENDITSYYVDYVITTVIEDLQKMGYTSRKARSLVYGGGLKIYTAIDFDVQETIEEVYENYENMPDETVQSSMVVMNYSGRVMGIAGGTGEKTEALSLNRATQSIRPPGSTIKPLSVYGPAIEKNLEDDDTKIYWSTVFQDSPSRTVEGKAWPVNQGGSYSSRYVTLQYGLSRSLNTISARVLDKIGLEYSYDFITERFHISTLDSVRDLDYGPLAIGSLTNGATVLEMTAAYAAFGNGGYYYEPYCYYKIEDSSGETIISKDPEKTKSEALSENTSWVMNKLLQTVMTEGTGTSYKLSEIECFGKTGTTNDDKDRWFIGGTPNYVAGVWYGYDTPEEIVYTLSSNPSGTIWNTVMKKVYATLDENLAEYDTEFPECEGIVRKSYGGSYGWYDVNNLPSSQSTSSSYTYSYTTAAQKTTAKKEEDETEEEEKASKEKTTANTTAPTEALETEAQTEV
ncbi:MAG: transglycosylase domain-containing protein [Clostridiales bacterium]|nr:transglycosylase domain-containing protein [Clostridiales bacterium]